MLFYAFFAIFLGLSEGQVFLPGSCPKASVVQDFVASKYLGKWYEVEKYPAIFEFAGSCITALYEENPNGTVKVTNTQKNILGRNTSIVGDATFVNSPSESKLTVVFPSLPVRFPAPYWVLETDYENYAVVWSCVNVLLINTQFLWILTRAREPSKEVLDQAYSVMKKNKLSKVFLTKTSQKNCPS